MTVEIDEHSGFCFGVVNAIRKAEQELERGELYCIGDIVHNDLEVRRLEEKGLRTIEHGEFAGLRDCRVLFRAHGEPPESYRTARENGVEVMIDDLPEYLLGMEGKTRVMIFDQPYNRDLVIAGAERVYSWYDIYSKIKSMNDNAQ